jgi:hypothetical protein
LLVAVAATIVAVGEASPWLSDKVCVTAALLFKKLTSAEQVIGPAADAVPGVSAAEPNKAVVRARSLLPRMVCLLCYKHRRTWC